MSYNIDTAINNLLSGSSADQTVDVLLEAVTTKQIIAGALSLASLAAAGYGIYKKLKGRSPEEKEEVVTATNNVKQAYENAVVRSGTSTSTDVQAQRQAIRAAISHSNRAKKMVALFAIVRGWGTEEEKLSVEGALKFVFAVSALVDIGELQRGVGAENFAVTGYPETGTGRLDPEEREELSKGIHLPSGGSGAYKERIRTLIRERQALEAELDGLVDDELRSVANLMVGKEGTIPIEVADIVAGRGRSAQLGVYKPRINRILDHYKRRREELTTKIQANKDEVGAIQASENRLLKRHPGWKHNIRGRASGGSKIVGTDLRSNIQRITYFSGRTRRRSQLAAHFAQELLMYSSNDKELGDAHQAARLLRGARAIN